MHVGYLPPPLLDVSLNLAMPLQGLSRNHDVEVEELINQGFLALAELHVHSHFCSLFEYSSRDSTLVKKKKKELRTI